MSQQPGGGAGGPGADIAIQAKEIIKTRERIARTVSDATGQDYDKVLLDMERDFWMSPKEATAYGIVDKVIQTIGELD